MALSNHVTSVPEAMPATDMRPITVFHWFRLNEYRIAVNHCTNRLIVRFDCGLRGVFFEKGSAKGGLLRNRPQLTPLG
jgi:hypothetical protein